MARLVMWEAPEPWLENGQRILSWEGKWCGESALSSLEEQILSLDDAAEGASIVGVGGDL